MEKKNSDAQADMSFAEIARELGVSSQAVIETYERAIRKFEEKYLYKYNDDFQDPRDI